MKIIYYTDQIYLHGGLERVLANKLTYFSHNTDFELHVITFQQQDNPPCYALPKNVQLHDLGIDYNRKMSFLHPSNLKLSLKHYLRLKRIIKKIKPDVIVVCNFEFGFYFIPLIAKKALKFKEFHSSRHFDYSERLKNKNILKEIKYKLSDYFEKKYDYLVLLTKDEQHYFKTNNTLIIPNAINNISSKKATLDYKRVISAGRIAPVKGLEYLITAWKDIIEKYPEWVLEIYGDGELDYVNQLKKQINNLNLNNNIIIREATNDLESKMLESSIYVMSSITECFPMVLLESMNYGLPIVSFDCPNGPRNIFKNGIDGLLIENNNVSELSSALVYLIKNKSKRIIMGRNAKQNVKRFSENEIMPLWLETFKYKDDN